MKVYKIESQDKLVRLNEKKIRLEKDIQKIIEDNLNNIFNLEFIETEFSVKNRRIDTLAYDSETKSFIIIEYKRDKSKSIVDQGYAYLGLLFEYQANFVLKYNEVKGDNKLIKDFDWSQSKIIFIANRFLEYSKEAVATKMPFELWEISKFDDDILILSKVEPKYSVSMEQIPPVISKEKHIEKEVQAYDEEYHIAKRPSYIRDLYENLKEEILNINENVEFKPVKLYIAFKINGNNFVSLFIYNKRIDVYLNRLKEYFDDPRDVLEDIPESYQWGKISKFKCDSIEMIPYSMNLIKQSYDFIASK
ncbi:MAG: DUF5655 domain-containing protein [Promethearchaeota archaeon]